MDSLIETFHLDIKLLIAQLVNFLIVFLVLWYFALKPLMKIMKDRTDKIEKSLKKAKEIDETSIAQKKERLKIIADAQKEAGEIFEKSKLNAEEKKKQMISQAKEEVEKVVADGKRQINSEKAKMLEEVKSEIADLVVLASEKLLNKKMDDKSDRDLISKALKEVNK